MEVVTTVGTTVLSVSLEWVIKKLGSKSSVLRNSQKHVRENLQNWKSFLPKLCAVLDDAEQRQTTNPAVQMWLSDLRHLAYDMEDVLDGLEADKRRKKLIADTNQVQPSTSRARKLFPICFTGFYNDDFIPDHDFVSKIKEISVRLERVVREKEALCLKVGEAGTRIIAPRWEPATTWLPEPHVYGREGDKDAILQKMLNDEGSDEYPCVIPIVGMGGLGKTTLARLVYNDDRLKCVFELKAWVCVSNEFDVLQITRSIIEQVTQKKCDFEDPSVLQEKVNKNLSGKKFLLVLDDVWSEDYCCWDVLQRVFISGGVGSKIIVTSRIEGVAKTMGASDRIYHLKELPENECMSLLARHAFGRENFDAHLYLKDIGEEIVKRCKGLPLAVKTLGGLLRGELNPDKWVKVLKSEMWELPEERCSILPALRLSYHHLPAHLKKCFAYCSLFPKDHEFHKDDLVLLWMAEGFVQQQKNGVRQRKSIGDQYFCDLLSRGLFQQSSTKQSCFVMHDLVHDLAQNVAGEICCNLEKMFHSEKMTVHFQKARHLSISSCGVDALRRYQFLDKSNNLRTFLALPSCHHYYEGHNTFFQQLLQKLRCLRVLSLNDKIVSEIPTSIGNLKHLRYIDISSSQIQSLPDSVRFLVYLQTLILRNCSKITELPTSIVDLVDLHHLDIRGTNSLQKMPSQMGKLTNLLMLPKFIVGKSSGLRLKELNNLKYLQGKLLIQDLHNVSNIEDANEANLCDIKGLDELEFRWTHDFHTSRNESYEMQVLSQLKPSSNLRRFKIDSYGGLQFPSWIGDPLFSKLEYLELCNCGRSTSLPRLGQLPQLKELVIRGMLAAKTMNPGFHSHNNSSFDSFPLLERLTLLDCPKLIGKLPGYIPSLIRLEIKGCPQLTYSPISLPSLQELYLDDCNEAVLRSVLNSTSLTKLQICRISELTCLPKNICMAALEALQVEECGELVFLLEDGDSISSPAANLKSITISKCPLLVSLAGQELKHHLPSSLEMLRITNCANLEHLPTGLHTLTCLKQLGIGRCKKFVGFLVTDFPLYLHGLNLSDLEALESLPDELMMTTEEIIIRNCPRLKSFPTGRLLATLQKSTIDSSTVVVNPQTNLSFPIDCIHKLSCLCYFEIVNCESLESLPERVLSMPTLKTLWILSCKNLKSLPNGMYNCESLQNLEISGCPGISSIAGGSLPLNLNDLVIDCEGLNESMLEYWGIDRLTSLKHLEINWICPPDDLLPSSLTTLVIKGVHNLESISKGLLQNLASLKKLEILDCPILKTLPKEGLPPSLEKFQIRGCPLLKQRCLKEKGDYWPLISHIQEINIC